MKNIQRAIPPYEGDEPYLYLAFAEADSAKARKLLRPLLGRGCRVWYCVGPSGSAEELRRRQARADGAALTVLYLTDAVCADLDTKSNVLVNQKNDRPILCLDPDGRDRRLSMGLREDVPHLPLYRLKSSAEIESAILHAEGFSQDLLGEPMPVREDSIFKKLSLLFLTLAVLLAAAGFVGYRALNRIQSAPENEISFQDHALQAAARKAAGGAVTEERAAEIRVLRLDSLPESWDELALLPALERIEIPQQALLDGGALPEGDYVIALSGGGA